MKLNQELSDDQRQELQEAVSEHCNIFSGTPGQGKDMVHRIATTSNAPVRMKPYPLPFHAREALKVEIEQMLDDGIIRKSESSYASPVVVVKK